jgi:pimeloyl-ACP methyl ester carboxylesterase
MQALFEHRLTLAGFETRILELEGEGPPVVLLHGFSDSADTWRYTLDRLGRRDRRAIALDMPGFGAAGTLRPGKILPQLDAFAAAAVEHVGGEAEPAVVAGNSLGGCVALRLAEGDDLPLAGVVPVAPAGLDMARWFVLIERDRLVRAVLSAPVPVPTAIVQAAVGRVYRTLAFADPGGIDGDVVSAFTKHLPTRQHGLRAIETGRRLLPELKRPFRFDRVRCPVLVVWGRQDRMVFPSGAQLVLDAIPDARLELIDDCGHCPQIEAPDAFAKLLLDFPASYARAA